jgi:hypothetical protein
VLGVEEVITNFIVFEFTWPGMNTQSTTLKVSNLTFYYRCLLKIILWHIWLNYLLKLINVSLSPRSTIRMALLGKSNSLTSSKLEWPSFSATKSGVSLPPNVSLAILPSVASYIISIMSVTYITLRAWMT